MSLLSLLPVGPPLTSRGCHARSWCKSRPEATSQRSEEHWEKNKGGSNVLVTGRFLYQTTGWFCALFQGVVVRAAKEHPTILRRMQVVTAWKHQGAAGTFNRKGNLLYNGITPELPPHPQLISVTNSVCLRVHQPAPRSVVNPTTRAKSRSFRFQVPGLWKQMRKAQLQQVTVKPGM